MPSDKLPTKGLPFQANFVGDVTFPALTAEVGNARTLSLQLRTEKGADTYDKGQVLAYLSTDNNGDTIAPTPPSGGVSAGTDGIVRNLEAGKVFLLISEDDGDIDVTISEAGVATWFLNVCLPNGSVKTSQAISFA